MLIITEYQIKWDAVQCGWIAFRVTKEGRRPFKLQDKVPLTTPKKFAHLAARALIRVLKADDSNLLIYSDGKGLGTKYDV